MPTEIAKSRINLTEGDFRHVSERTIALRLAGRANEALRSERDDEQRVRDYGTPTEYFYPADHLFDK